MKFVTPMSHVVAIAMTLVLIHHIVIPALVMRAALIQNVFLAQIALLEHTDLCNPKTK